MASPYGEDTLDDVPIDDFRGATLRLDPSSGQPSRSVSPSSANGGGTDETSATVSHRPRPALYTARSEPTHDVVTPPSPENDKNFYCGTGLSRSFYQQPPIGQPRRASWHAEPAIDNGIRDFFSMRTGTMDKAIEECRHLLDPDIDGDLKGAWLLTEIDHWDIEKERLVILSNLSMLIIKYDFIALRHLDYTRIPLKTIDQLQIGELVYPDTSLVPRINGLAGGVVTVIRGCLWNRIQGTISSLSSRSAEACNKNQNLSNEKCQFTLSSVSFEPRSRNMQGIRVTRESRQPLSFSQKWNPWSRDIPFTTLTSHPLYWYTGCENTSYDVKHLATELSNTLEALQERPDVINKCNIFSSPIVIENYVGIASLLHNATELGFFKLRGKDRADEMSVKTTRPQWELQH